MKLGIMQPYFFPALGYFDLINCTDKWVVFDVTQFKRHGWMNRNRILHPKDGWQYISAPLDKYTRSISIKDVLVKESINWKERIMGQLVHYKKRAPYYNNTISFLQDCFSTDERRISKLNIRFLKKACERLEIKFNYQYFSEMNLEIGPIEGPGDWALRISEAMEAEEYINPPGGRDIFNANKYKKAGIKLTIREFKDMEYNCRGYKFIPTLSIIDVFMWNHCDDIKRYLSNQLNKK